VLEREQDRGDGRLAAMTVRLPSPMLARSSVVPNGDYAFEVKWDGFRASSAGTATFLSPLGADSM
jgi:ATP-dependent DNA ligase